MRLHEITQISNGSADLVRVHAIDRQDHDKSVFDRGRTRTRFPIASKIALHTAGGTGGSAGSPRPVGGFAVVRKCT
jgi:hypothetical protein